MSTVSKHGSKMILIPMIIGTMMTRFVHAESEFAGSIDVVPSTSYSRLTISLDESFKPQVVDEGQSFRVVIPAATLMDLGIPYGAEGRFNDHLKTLQDARVEQIRVKETDGQIVITGKYRFPSGPQAFARPQMEHFDFWKKEAGKYLVDFFYKKGPTLAEVERQKRMEEEKRLQFEKEQILKKEAEKRASREKRILEGRNALLFCEQPFNRETNVFLRFKVDHPLIKLSNYFPENLPDHGFDYPEPKGKSEEAEMVRLAYKLSLENKHALTIKTIDFFEKQYPRSKMLNEMLFLKSNCLYRLGLVEQGRALIQQVSRRAQGTNVGVQATAFLAVQSYQKKEWLSALESFMNLKKVMNNHPLKWLFHYGIAESLFQIRQTDQAKVEYEWVAKHAPKPEIRAEARFKVGDTYFERSQYARAITSYQAALTGNETHLYQYPHVLFNLGESYFQLEEYDRAQTVFLRYLEFGRTQPEAWRASLRAAEILAIRNKINDETQKAFIETINRYPMSPGALIARIRLLPCGDHGGFDLPSVERLIQSPEITQFDQTEVMYIGPFKDLVAVTEVRTLISFQQDQSAIERGIARLRENPSGHARRLIEYAMIGGIKRVLERQLSEKDDFGAIATYEKYGDFLPLPSHDPLVDDLKMKLASIASEKKLTTLAVKIIEPYKKMNEATQKEVIAAIEKNLVLEGVDEQEERNLIEAKTIWNNQDFKPEQGDELIARLSIVRDESKLAFERDLIKSLYYFSADQEKKADELNQTIVKRIHKLKAAQKAQVWAWSGEVAIKAQNFDFAARCFEQARSLSRNVSEKDRQGLNFRQMPSIPSQAYLFQNEGESLEKQQKWKEAVALYTQAIENKVGGNHLLYAHARALLKVGGKGSKQVASRSLEQIRDSQDNDVWKNLAQEALKEIAKEGKTHDQSNP